MSEEILLFRENELPPDSSRIKIVIMYSPSNRIGFKTICIHCKTTSESPELITQKGHILCPNCHQEL
jgi:hypothetical protein